jgi:cubilin
MSGCGGQLSDESGVITSPNYPGPYPSSTECIWTVQLAPGKRINVTIDDLNVESHSNCQYDVLEVSRYAVALLAVIFV